MRVRNERKCIGGNHCGACHDDGLLGAHTHAADCTAVRNLPQTTS